MNDIKFLQECIDKVNVLTNEEINAFKKAYDSICCHEVVDSIFEFILPYNDLADE